LFDRASTGARDVKSLVLRAQNDALQHWLAARQSSDRRGNPARCGTPKNRTYMWVAPAAGQPAELCPQAPKKNRFSGDFSV